MLNQKVIIIFAITVLVGFGLYLLLNQTKHVSVETTIMNGQIENSVDNADTSNEETSQNESDEAVDDEKVPSENMTDEAAMTEEQPLPDDENSQPLTITEEIKEKVREVLQGAIKLFKKDLKIVSVGDSLTQGVGDETENGGYVGILNHTFEDNNLKINIENYGKRGNRTDQLLKRLENEEISDSIKKADIVLLTIGANDIMKIVRNNFTNLNIQLFNQEKANYIERLRAIFDKINELNPEAQIYLIGFYNPFDRYLGDIVELEMIINDWNTAGQLVTDEYENATYIPIADLFRHSNVDLLADDYFHPNTSGYKLIAERVLDNLEEMNDEIDEETEVTAEEVD